MSGNGLAADLVATTRLLTRLTDDELITFQTFADQGDGRHFANIHHGTLAGNGNALQDLNQADVVVLGDIHRICVAYRPRAEKHRG